MARAKSTSDTQDPQTHSFGAEVSRLLEILVHSVYADREVFLRELISNAADACDKLRYEAVTTPDLLRDDSELRITISADKEAGRLTVADNGIGMTAEELADNLGTIAKSGTLAFMEAAGGSEAPAANLIGQFGIGFYSAFIVASEVQVISRRAGTDEAWAWTSDGAGTYTVSAATAEDGEAVVRGTEVRLKLRDGMDEFLETARLGAIVRAHSDHISFPIDLVQVTAGEPGKPERANTASALWTRPKSDITAEQYREFYGSLSGLFDEPAHTIHYKAEGRHEYDVLLFVPSKRPFDLFDPARTARVKLYVRRVLISEDAAILPPYLRFVRGVVDSADMPLTISRDMLQENPVAQAIRRAVTNRVLSTLAKQAEKKPDEFVAFWQEFGAVLKEGLYEDYDRRDELLDLARFRTTAGSELRSLKDYVADLKDNQTAIYYLTGDDADRIAQSPQLEGFRARGIEVLLLTDPVDNFWTQGVMGYQGKPFKSVTQGSEDIGAIDVEKADDAAETTDEPRDADVASALAFIKQTLGDKVADVRSSDRLVESPACLVAADGALDRGLERMLREREGGKRAAPILEINPRHKLIAALAGAVKDGGDAAEAAAHMIFDCAVIADGDVPADPKGFGERVQAMLEKALT